MCRTRHTPLLKRLPSEAKTDSRMVRHRNRRGRRAENGKNTPSPSAGGFPSGQVGFFGGQLWARLSAHVHRALKRTGIRPRPRTTMHAGGPGQRKMRWATAVFAAGNAKYAASGGDVVPAPVRAKKTNKARGEDLKAKCSQSDQKDKCNGVVQPKIQMGSRVMRPGTGGRLKNKPSWEGP